jgi:hypothetical protein
MRSTKQITKLISILVLLVIFPIALPAKTPVKFDHLWLVVSPGAPERKALEEAGFNISPEINHHDGQGTSSITVEFFNSYLELIWVDETVSIAPGGEKGVGKFRQRMLWRQSGWSPFGVGLHRTGTENEALPLPVWTIAPTWLQKGTAIEMLTPRDDAKSPSFFTIPEYLAVNELANWKSAHHNSKSAKKFSHQIGVERITGIRFISPQGYEPIEAFTYLQNLGIIALDKSDEWAAELTFDNGRKGKTKDLRPNLPLLLRY